jgi:heme/copper-type cytochrome/quinol oxidase subunit 2
MVIAVLIFLVVFFVGIIILFRNRQKAFETEDTQSDVTEPTPDTTLAPPAI